MSPQSIQKIPFQQIRGIFSDLDDTLTDRSLLLPKTLDAIHRLRENNYQIVLVSGRPAGWADSLMRLLPVDAMIFENGAGLMWKENEKVFTHCLASDQDRASQKSYLEGLFSKIKNHLDSVKLATDQPYRLFDFAIDFNEEPPYLSTEQVDWIMNFLSQDPHVTAKLSSIHINFWVGAHTKLTACNFWLQMFGSKRGVDKNSILYTGDSPNDEPLFQFFPNSVGVANVKRFLQKMTHPPKFITSLEGGKGFVELVDMMLQRNS